MVEIQRGKNLCVLVAAYVGDRDCLDVLIKGEADVNCAEQQFDKDCRKKIGVEVGYTETTRDPFTLVDGGTPLIYASALGHLENIKLLVKQGATVNAVKCKRTALGMAAERGHYECLQYLVEAGANVNVADPSVKPALMYAVHSSDSSNISDNQEKCVQLLLKTGADVNVFYSGDWLENTTPLLKGVKFGNQRIISILLAAGADVNGDEFPLHTALSHKPFPCIKLLIQAGADVNRQDSFQMTPLHLAVSRLFETKTIRLLLESGADVNIPDEEGLTPLMKAANHCISVLVMISKRRYEYQNSDDWDNHRVQCLRPVRVLLKIGVQINRKYCNGDNALKNVVRRACYSLSPESPDHNQYMHLYMLLYAAGETLDGPLPPKRGKYGIIGRVEIPEYFVKLKENLELKHLCREAIRKHLIDLDPHEHLLGRIPQLGLPYTLEKYMVYTCDINEDTGDHDCDDNDDDY